MAFDFPASPAEGASYSPAGGPRYVYTSGVWRSTGMVATGTAEARNRLVNPAMQISQENGNAAVGTGAYPVDQWIYSTTIAGAGQRTGGATPNGSLYTVRMNQPTAKPSLAVDDFVGLAQFIEGIRVADFQWGTASAKQVVLRFTFWSTKAGTFSIAIVGSPSSVRSYVDTFTISAGEANSYQVRTFVIPGDTSGTWLKDNQSGMSLWISAALGSSYTTATKGWQAGEKYGHTSITNNLATAGDFYLGDVGLYLDPNNTGTPPPWQMPDEAQELASCQRYWQQVFMHYGGYVATGGTYFAAVSLQVASRISPALSGTPYSASGFAAAVGTIGMTPSSLAVTEGRSSTGTVSGGYFQTFIIANARM